MSRRSDNQVGPVLLLAATRKDGAVTQDVLREAGIACRICADLPALLRELGPDAGAVVLPEEVLISNGAEELASALEQQPPWSDLPVLVLTRSGVDSPAVQRALELLGNVILLERPTRVAAFVSAIHSALRARRRQQQLHRHLIELQSAQQRLCESDQRKDEFLAMLAHELRNPLAPIRDAVQVLRLSDADATRGRLYALVERQVHHLVRLVDDLLEVARISRGALVLRPEPVDLRDVLRQAVETSRPLIAERRHELRLVLPPAPVPLEADPVRLAQVFANLLNNAARYTPPGGHIAIDAAVEGQLAAVTVVDDGAGLAPDLLPRVFDLFVRGRPSAAQASAGLGVGLSLSRRLVEMHGGSIEAHSEGPGRGSRFVVKLPITSRAAFERAGAGSQRGARPPSPRRVLVVDDNRDAADSLGLLLEHLGARARVVHDGEEALAALDEWDAEIVLLDLGMPGMDGFEVARRIRRDPRRRSVILVALTGWGQEEDRRRTRAAGFDHHLVKPADLDTLRALFDSVGERDARPRPGVETGT